MSFKKDAEIKVFVKSNASTKNASEEEKEVRYTVDDLVKDSENKKEEKDVSN